MPDPTHPTENPTVVEPVDVEAPVQNVLEDLYEQNKSARRILQNFAPLPSENQGETGEGRPWLRAVIFLLLGTLVTAGLWKLQFRFVKHSRPAGEALLEGTPVSAASQAMPPAPARVYRTVHWTPKAAPLSVKALPPEPVAKTLSPEPVAPSAEEPGAPMAEANTASEAPTVPQNLSAEFISTSHIELRWESLGDDYSYQLYKASSENMKDAVRQGVPVPATYIAFFPNETGQTVWVAISGIGPHNEETRLSKAIPIRLP